MNSNLNRRILRELRSHFGRYLALFAMIVMGMYLVVSIAGMAERTIQGTDAYNDRCNIQDGQFTTFIPLDEDQLNDLSSEYGTIEESFYFDITTDDNKVIRVFRNRTQINLAELDEGSLPGGDNEIVLMNLFAQRNAISVGDSFRLAGTDYTVSGIGCVPDYNLPVRNFSDMTADPTNFGIAIVSDDEYTRLRDGEYAGSESYTYSFILNEGVQASDLKEAIKDLEFDYNNSGNEYLIEYVDRLTSDRTEFEDALTELTDGTNELCDGIADYRDGVEENNGNFAVLEGTHYEGLVQITEGYLEAAGELQDGASEYRDGVSEFDEEVRDFLDENFEVEIPNLESFYENKDNPRIASDAASDVILKRAVALVAGAILVMLFAYVISVFVIHQINEESSVIGTLYSMGISKSTLTAHYVALPTIVTFLAGLVGMFIGFGKYGVDFQMLDSYLYYSIPQMDKVYPLYIIIYCIVLPPVIAVIVNILVINKKLSQTALSLIKNEQNIKAGTAEGKSSNGSFIIQFMKRQFTRERRSVFTVVIGMVFALLILMIGINCYVLCNNVRKENIEDINYEYMYIVKFPTEEVPEGGEACYVKNLSVTYLDYSLDVNVIGIEDDSEHYPFVTSGNQRDLVIASSTAQKYGLSVGDTLVMEDTSTDRRYAFVVSDIVDYSIGLTAYMDIDEMRDLFGEADDYYNMLVSDEKLDIEEGRIQSVTTRTDIENAAGIFVDQMMSLIVILIAVSGLIFVSVMYLMLNVMIDRASFGISLVKIFGYRMKEIKRVYLDSNFYAVALGAVVGIPFVKLAADAIYPYFIANTAMGMNLVFKWYFYIAIFAGAMIVYKIICAILTGKIRRIVPAEVLKNRE